MPEDTPPTLPAEVASLIPVDEITTNAELLVARSEALTAIDQILDSAAQGERDMNDDELAVHDAYVARCDDLNAAISAIAAHEATVTRSQAHEARRRMAVPNINRITTPPARADRNLDELLWASRDVVRAGSFDKTGAFRPNPYGATNPVEQVIVRSDDGNPTRAPRLDEFRPEHQNVVRSFQSIVTDMCLFGVLVDRDAKTSSHGFQVARNHRLFKDDYEHILRALDVDTSGEGGTWVPTGIGMDLHEKVRASGKVAALFSRIDLPTNPWKWPIEGADASAYRVGEPTTDTETKVTASTPGTVAATFDAEIMGGRVLFSRSVEADSVQAILPYVKAKLVQAFVDAEEKAILDGDTDGTHQDADTQAVGATHFSSAWDGLRKKALAETATNTNAATTVANLAALRASMGKWGVNPANLAWIVGVTAFHALIQDDAVETVEKFGPNATILNGQLGSLYGIPIIVSEHVREDLNASGVEDGITTNESYNLCVNRNEFAIGQRMATDVEVDDSIYRETFQRVVVAFQREDFQHIGDAAANDDVAIGYGIA